LLAPGAGEDVVRRTVLRKEVHRHHRELVRGAALEEQDLMAVGDAEETGEERDRLVVHRLVLLAAVAVLDDRHSRALEVDELVPGALEGREWKPCRAGVEVDGSHAGLLHPGEGAVEAQSVMERPSVSAFLGASLDGFIAEADGGLGFLKPFEQEEHGYAEFYASVDTLLMGRKTYETVLGFDAWPFPDKRVAVLTRSVRSPR